MAVERGYERQVAPRAAPMGRMVSAESYGAGLADAVGRGAEDLHNREIRAYQLDRKETADQEAADFDHGFAEFRPAADDLVRDLRGKSGPGGAGHQEAVDKALDAGREKLFAGITDQQVLRQAQGRWDEYRAQVLRSEGVYQEGQHLAKRAIEEVRTDNFSFGRIRRSDDPETYKTELKINRDAIFAAPGYSDAEKEERWDKFQQGAGVAFNQHLMDTNPRVGRAMLDTGTFDHLKPEVLETLRNGYDVEIRRRDGEQRAQALAAKAEARESISTLNARIEAGEDVPQAEIARGAQLATTIGDDSGAFKLEVAGVKTGVNRETWAWRPGDYEENINALRALGEKRTPEQDIRLKQLEAIAPGRIAEFNANPGGYMASIGKPPPPLNLSDPASIEARMAWRRTAQATTGRPVSPLSKNEAAEFAAELNGPGGKAKILDQVALFGAAGAADIARQIAPNDPAFHQLTGLATLRNQQAAREAVRDVLQGADARKAHARIWDRDAKLQALDTFNEFVGSALDPSSAARVAVMENASLIYASVMAREGYGESGFNADIYRVAVGRALGMARVGGEVQGGIGTSAGYRIILPENMSQAGFDRRVSRATAPEWLAAAGGAEPVWEGGATVFTGDLRMARKLIRGDGIYAFQGPGGGVIQKRGGGEYRVDVRRLGR